MNNSGKNIEYYMNLTYTIEVTKIPDDEGGGYCACIPVLGRWAFIGDGETPEEAIQHLEEVKRDLFEEYIRKGFMIPEPTNKN